MKFQFFSALIFISFPLLVSGQTRTSISSGDFDDASSWDCSCVPSATENIIVESNHVISLTSNETINDVTIKSDGTLDGSNKVLTISGDLLVDGALTGDKEIRLTGSGTTIDGHGAINNKRKLWVKDGGKTILSTAELVRNNGEIKIDNGLTVTNYGTITCSKNIQGANSSAKWINGVDATVNCGGKLMATGILDCTANGNTVTYYKSGNQDIETPVSGQYHHLKLNGTGTKELQDNITVIGDLRVESSVLTFKSSNKNVTLKGHWFNAGTFNEGTGTVAFSGSANQSVEHAMQLETFYDLSVNKSAGDLTFVNDVIVSNDLEMLTGDIELGENTLTLGTSTSNEGTLQHTSGTICGKFERWINSAGQFYMFPVGSQSSFNSIQVSFNTLISGGSLIAEFISAPPQNDGLPVVDASVTIRNSFVEGHWGLTTSNFLVSADYDVKVQANNFSSFTITDATRVLVRENAALNWTVNGSNQLRSGNYIRRQNMIILPCEIAIGDTTNCSPPLISAISGPDSVCTNSVQTYSVTNVPADTYTWNVVNGAITSGQGTSSINVLWDNIGASGSVEVYQTNACTKSITETMEVNIHALPVNAITGKTYVAENTNSELYFVTKLPGYSYTWSIVGGAINSGQGTDSVYADWGNYGFGQICVQASNGCGTSSNHCEDVTIYKVINSAQTGDWDDPSTWDCSCIPTSLQNVRILNTHTVSLNGNEEIKNFVVNGGGTLNTTNDNITINGFGTDLTIDGEIIGSGDVLVKGTDTSIDGTGELSNTGKLRIEGGTKTVLATASLNKSSGFIDVKAGVIMFNHGIMTVAGDIKGNNSLSTWINEANSSLHIGGDLFNNSNGGIIANSEGNTIDFNGAGTQKIIVPNSGGYFNLRVSENSISTIQGDILVENNLSILDTAQLDVHSLNHSLTLNGNWINTSVHTNPFVERGGLVTFNGSETQLFKSGETFYSVTVNLGSSIKADSVDGQIEIKGDLINNGTFETQEGIVTFSGSSNQQLSGNIKYNDLVISNSAGVNVISGTHSVSGVVSVQNGTFNTNNDLVLLSDSSGTGSIGYLAPSANVIGDVTVQRFLSTSNAGWRFISSACAGQTIGDLDDELITTGFSGSDYPSFGWVNMYAYDETQPGAVNSTASYVVPNNTTDALNVGEGYWFYMGGPITWSTKGAINKFNTVLPTSYTNSGSPDDDGFSLVGNPYPCSIDWKSASGWTKTNIDDAIYIYDADNGQYSSFVEGIGTNGGSRYIPSQQAFYVKANAAAPSLQVNENVKVNVDEAFKSASSIQEKIVRIELNGLGYTDEAVLRFNDLASASYDSKWDAAKMTSLDENAPFISTISNGVDYSINALNNFNNDISIPVRAKVGMSGSYTLKVKDVNGFFSNRCVILEDLSTGAKQNIAVDSVYTFSIIDTVIAPRFLIHLGTSIETQGKNLTCYDSNDGIAIAKGTGLGPWSYEWLDSYGNIVSVTPSTYVSDTISHLSDGIYSVQVTSSSGLCPNFYDTIHIHEPHKIQIQANETSIDCFGSANGEIDVSIEGGVAPYTYKWTGGSIEQDLSNLSAGIYALQVFDSKSCIEEKSFEIKEPTQILTNMSANHIGGAKCEGSCAVEATGGSGELNFMWNFGSYTSENVLENVQEGMNFISVKDENNCVVHDSIEVKRLDDCNSSSLDAIELYPNPTNGEFTISSQDYNHADLHVEISDILGKIIYSRHISNKAGLINQKIDISYQPSGTYLLRVSTTEDSIVRKIVLK